jgi:hypothetical protein
MAIGPPPIIGEGPTFIIGGGRNITGCGAAEAPPIITGAVEAGASKDSP